jgi:lysozyme
MSTTYAGFDISHHQQGFDFQLARRQGYTRCYLKASQGSVFKDPSYATFRQQAEANEILHGAYHFVDPTIMSKSQVVNFLTALDGTVGNLPPVLDAESSRGKDPWMAIELDTRINLLLNMRSQIIRSTGIDSVGLYASPSFIDEVLNNDPRLSVFKLWIAEYGVSVPRIPAPFTTYYAWQYSESGTIGNTEEVDLNTFMV